MWNILKFEWSGKSVRILNILSITLNLEYVFMNGKSNSNFLIEFLRWKMGKDLNDRKCGGIIKIE